MPQKVLKVGSSLATTIPKNISKKLGIKAGDTVNLEYDPKKNRIMIEPVQNLSKDDLEVLKIANDFIERYRDDLESLADR